MTAPRRLALLATIAAAAGCPGTDPPTPDPDGGVGGDGLRLVWVGQPAALPGATPGGAVLERAAFHLSDLRVVGDAGTLELERERLEWSREATPPPDAPSGAPAGMYSRLRFDLEGDDDEPSYELAGAVTVAGVTRPYVIRDGEKLAISIDLQVALAPGGRAQIGVQVAHGRIVDAVNFAQVPILGGAYVVDKSSSQIGAVRAAARAAFAIASGAARAH
jgi:hypothetical protein